MKKIRHTYRTILACQNACNLLLIAMKSTPYFCMASFRKILIAFLFIEIPLLRDGFSICRFNLPLNLKKTMYSVNITLNSPEPMHDLEFMNTSWLPEANLVYLKFSIFLQNFIFQMVTLQQIWAVLIIPLPVQLSTVSEVWMGFSFVQRKL